MARTYREIAIEKMLATVEEAMSQVIDWWGDLPPKMKEAVEQFRTQLGAAIDTVEFVKRAHSTDKYTKLTAGKACLMFACARLPCSFRHVSPADLDQGELITIPSLPDLGTVRLAKYAAQHPGVT